MHTMALIAFWRYDSFPGLLHGTVRSINVRGEVETLEYGPGAFFRPFLILPSCAETEALIKRLKDIEAQHNQKISALRAESRSAVKEAFAHYPCKFPDDGE